MDPKRRLHPVRNEEVDSSILFSSTKQTGEQATGGFKSLMEAVCLPLEYRQSPDGRRKVVIGSGDKRNYVLFNPGGQNLRDKPLAELAREFVQELRGKGLLKIPQA
jgi:hypothetical protein